MNKIIITGRISQTPFTGVTGSNTPYTRFTVAVSRRQFSSNTEPITDFLPCVAWAQNAEFINKFLDKGSLVLIEGSLQTSRMTKNGEINTFYTINVDNIEALETKKIAQMRRQEQNRDTIDINQLENHKSTQNNYSFFNDQSSYDNDANINPIVSKEWDTFADALDKEINN
ncbi:single-stranded DNA-binding protein [Mycoplasma miroungirhinis]|uniref:Single-stranded DNA-binding protein n=1 Tax=Mycoplasma miroungirhinis TaxID=754516 RepID=A0A6M4JHB2_9MOLU|nr:single-stranded DNA-binding protein [Mycoplasma miroungirhinis]QJR44412.1 single-stranded DNA-binding protein [Mycoplasma miroungirhinis]